MYPYVVGVICILWLSWIYLNFVDIICIGHITSYLARNVGTIFHVYSFCVSDWCITSFTVFNSIFCSVHYSCCLVNFMSDYKMNPNPIWMYVPPFITSIKDSFSFPLNFRFSCCIGVLYYNISQYIHMTDKEWCLSDFRSVFVKLNMGNGPMPINL